MTEPVMKLAARVALAVVVLLAGLFILPRSASRVVAPDAFGQVPTGLPTDVIDLSPSPSPKKTKPPPPPPDDDKPKGGGDNNDPGTGSRDGGNGGNNGPGGGGGKSSTKGPGKGDKKADAAARAPAAGGAARYAGKKFNATGEFTTDKLQLAAARLKAEGLSETKILRLVYTPFIIGGPAAWT
ncbi:MAG: hypothetical protein M3280_05555, partial [Actinomycetota bacterium]|nr:hypothetical protein [Actinomycetota bacterium]